MQNRVLSLTLATLVLTGLGACSRLGSVEGWFGTQIDKIISNRAHNEDRFLAVLRLKQLALLSRATVDGDGVTRIDAGLAKLVNDEQATVVRELAELSGDIKILYRYRLTVNGLAIVAPIALQEKIQALHSIASFSAVGDFQPPVVLDDAAATAGTINERNSVKFIGGDIAKAAGITGQGTRVGIIDTGIDYTHAMFGGAGTAEAYKAIDPAQPNAAFPSQKVVGGIDLVGTEYDAASGDFGRRVPKMDANPLDEGGHGSHVAGTVAGRGDGVHTYDGVAPDAQLYAIKVFGKDGSTNDSVVVAALEYAADPNGDLNLDDQLDVVNLSLGSGYGNPHSLYGEAMGNLVRGGTSVVASGGNSGPADYIVGSPGIVDEAFSVAASTDDADANWKYSASRLRFVDGELLVETIEGPVSKPVAETGNVSGELVYIGLADQPLPEDVQARVRGQVAFIDRGGVSFVDKVQRAFDAGAIGVVVANSVDGTPIAMGGTDEPIGIPAIMVTKTVGLAIKEKMKIGAVSIDFAAGSSIEKPENIDTLTSFSSKGPRSVDGFLKPEISAPGSLVLSAAMGGGATARALSGTSMAAPHLAGVMALLTQKFPQLRPLELKSLAMGQSKTIADPTGKVYPLSRQGAGRVQIGKALTAAAIAIEPALSLGEQSLTGRKVLRRTVTLRNLTAQTLTLTPQWHGSERLTLKVPARVVLDPNASQTIRVDITLNASGLEASSAELDGWLFFNDGAAEVVRLPVLAIVNQLASVTVDSLRVRADSAAGAEGAAALLKLSNPGTYAGSALAFNLIGQDTRKPNPTHSAFVSGACDLQASGYRVVTRPVEGEATQFLQIGVKLFDQVTTWNACEISVLIDADGDEVPEQELVGTVRESLAGLTGTDFVSILLDAAATRDLRRTFEGAIAAGNLAATENYAAAVRGVSPMTTFNHSSVAVIEVDTALLARRATGELAVKVLTTHQESSTLEYDDYLGGQARKWKRIDLDAGQSYRDFTEVTSVKAGESVEIEFTKGAGQDPLLLLFPHNRPRVSTVGADAQMALPKAQFSAE